MIVCSYWSQELSWRKNPNTEGEKHPALLAAHLVLVVCQLLTDLTVNLISETENVDGFLLEICFTKKNSFFKKIRFQISVPYVGSA